MIDKYQQDVAEYGIAKVVSENYEQDSSCHPEVYCPKHGEYYGWYPAFEQNKQCALQPFVTFTKRLMLGGIGVA